MHGTATAASIWATGAIGASVGYAEYEIALSVGLITFLTLLILTPLERRIDAHASRREEDS